VRTYSWAARIARGGIAPVQVFQLKDRLRRHFFFDMGTLDTNQQTGGCAAWAGDDHWRNTLRPVTGRHGQTVMQQIQSFDGKISKHSH